ncbi:D-beta-hydroxybutyrate dehydrogenase, mitochondrial-like [Mya arenaria]|uniref:D-beta-hydroxybutyrate dehydrogenase, mitochondrial-like n=1 Tax=Mya arenaria TaxID=6604 RepID=UPI0022E8E9A1|nr:D-beta-hydroxybutyrate dehydrogenase, mitochondrial-like [Mya arenaria]
MMLDNRVVFLGYLLVSALFFYWVLLEAYIYIGVLVFLHVAYKKWKKNSAQTIDPHGKAVLITGCDTGFGHQIALRLHNQGFTVFAGCLFPQGDGARAFRDRKCARLQVLHLDVTKDDHVKEALKAIKKKLPANGLWAILNNAAINYMVDIEFSSIDLMKRIEEVNYYGMVRVTKAFIPLLRTSRGRIINVTSVKGRIALPSDVAYTTTKWAGEAFSDILRREMYRFGIRVVLIEPGNFGGITGMLNTETLSKMEATLEECWTLASDEVKEAYGREYINQQVAGLKASGSTSAPEVEPVVDAMQEAVCNTSPEYRYLIHGSSKPLDWYCVCAKMNELLPEGFMDWFLEFTSPLPPVAKHV